jgi:hypothetical protein
MTRIALAQWLAAGTLAVVGVEPLGAQHTPESVEQIPVVPGTTRDSKSEAQLQAGADPSTHLFRVYRIGASMELLFKYYLGRLGGQPGQPGDTTPTVRAGDVSPVTYRLAFHAFDDECADPPAPSVTPAPSGGPTPCRLFRRGKDKRNALDRVRIPYDRARWIEDASFTWFRRDLSGVLTRLRVDLRDVGLSDNWKRYDPQGQLLFESVVLGQQAP